MEIVVFLTLIAALFATNSDAAQCAEGWVAYKDETCVGAFPDLLTHAEAQLFCASQSTDVSTCTLATVKESELQVFLANVTADIFENFWLGGKFDNESNHFKWEDGEAVEYSNWAEGFPRNRPDLEICIQLRPENARLRTPSQGKWEDAVCQKRNLALCQRPIVFNLQEATGEIRRLRKQLEEANAKVSSVERKVVKANVKINRVNSSVSAVQSRVNPVGSIYIEYSGQPDPQTLWSDFVWEDITSTYEGLFFRALGGGSGDWGATQEQCSPQISQMAFSETEDLSLRGPSPLTIPAEGWSDYGQAGYNYYSGRVYYERLRFYRSHCEVRPNNQAIRIWKRVE